MSGVRIDKLRKEYPGAKSVVVAVDDVTLEIYDGEMLVLLGPSGCGKTTTLRCLAGLELPTAGSIHFGDRPVFDRHARIDVTPERRDIGMVFQSYALWPHKTVEENIAYPLRARRLRRQLKSREWVSEAARAVGCEDLLDRYPSQLSGGQQQRVALARAIVARPAVILFDEPLSNLDARLRDSVRTEIHQLHRTVNFTGIYVTHDQNEAFALGSRLAVMRQGMIEQLGTPSEIYDAPTTEYVADFVGFVNSTQLKRSGRVWAGVGGQVTGYHPALEPRVKTARLRLRPEDLRLLRDGDTPANHCLLGEAIVVDFSYGGRHLDVLVKLGDAQLRAHYALRPGDHTEPLTPGQTVRLTFDPRRSLCFADATGLTQSRENPSPPSTAPSSTADNPIPAP